MKGISRRKFAKLDGCSEKLVRIALEKGRLIAFDDGSIDIDLAGTPWRRRADKAADKGAKGADNRTPEDITYAEAQRLKEIYLGKLRKLEFEIKSGRFVEAAGVENAVFELARQERDALQNWPSRVAPLIAAEFGVDQIALNLAMDKHVRTFLSERSAPKAIADTLHWRNKPRATRQAGPAE